MKRREVLKGLSAAALWPYSGWALQDAGAGGPAATAVRGLVNGNGKLQQPIRIALQASTSSRVVVTKLNGQEADRRTVAAGEGEFAIYADPVAQKEQARVDVEVDGKASSAQVTLQPVRKVLVYILPHSHHDLGYTNLQADVEEKQMTNISRGIEMAQKTADYPEGARFVWNLEVLWGADLYMRRKSEAEKAALVDAVRKGQVALNAMYANELSGLCRPEELLQLFRYGGVLGQQCGVRVDAAMQSDVPGYTWGLVTAMAQAGVRYFSGAPNYFDRIGSFMVEWQDKPCWWVSRSGREKVLFWVPWTGYAMSHVMKLGTEWVGKYQDRLDEVKFPYDVSYIRWSGHGDNAEPDPELSEWVKGWSEEYAWPKFRIASTSEAFAAFEKRHGQELPEFRGDLTPYWEDGAGSSALETRMNRNAADRLVQAETLTAMTKPASYQANSYGEAWRNVLLYSEHTWGAWCSVSDSENPFTTKQWDVKRGFAVDAQQQSESLLEQALTSAAQSASSELVVYNTTSWPRTEVVTVARELAQAGDRVTDARGHAVASQRLASGELAFVAADVPGLGRAAFRVGPGEAGKPERQAARAGDGVLENELVRVRVDPATGDIVELTLHGEPANLAATAGEHRLNQYLFLEGKDVAKVQTSGAARVVVEERGPLVASLRIESAAPGCNSLVRRLRLCAGMDWVELTNVVDKKRAPLNPHPGQGGPGDEFAQRGAKESVQFAFPLAVEGGQMRMDIPLAEMRPEADQLPGACKNWLPVGRWIDVSNAERGVTWATLDAPLVEIGEISARMLGSQHDPSVWRKRIDPTQSFYSWVMNNHWGTNYRAYQEGVVAFRYALRPHRGADLAACSRFAIGLSQPLLAAATSHARAGASLLAIEPAEVLVLTMKPSDDGRARMVRLWNASDEERRARLRWRGPEQPRIQVSDLNEGAGRLIENGTVTIAGWDVVTLRVEGEHL